MLGLIWAGAATVAAPGLRRMLRRRAARGKEVAARLPEREGIDETARPPGRLVWVHAASVGESVSVLPVIEALVRDGPVLVTTGTVNSAAVMAERLPAGAFHRFVPLDVPRWGARFLDHWRPAAAVFVESELWPNLVAACRARGVALALVNGRLSERSARGWGRAAGLAREMLGAFDLVHPQSEGDGARLAALGARGLVAPGNLKRAAAAAPVDAAELDALRAALGDRPVWLAASTHPGEEAVVARVHARLAGRHAGLLTIVAPRHPERGVELAAELGAARYGVGELPPAGGVWLADVLGKMGLLYRVAPVVLVGGSLVDKGGQNPLEAARLGCATAIGPFHANAAEAVGLLRAAGGLVVVADEAALFDWADAMLGDAAARQAAGAAGQAVATGEDGLPERLARLIGQLVE